LLEALPALYFHRTWEHLAQLMCEHIHGISLRTPSGMGIDFQSRCHVRVPQLSLCNFERQYFPRGTDLSPISQAQLDQVSLRLNQRPRKP
jgi:hypothetical protein